MERNIKNRNLTETEELKKSLEVSKKFLEAAVRNGFRLCDSGGAVSLNSSLVLLDVFGRRWLMGKAGNRVMHFNYIVGIVKPSRWPIIRRFFVGERIATIGFYHDEILIAVHDEKNCSDPQLKKFLDEFQKIVEVVAAGRQIRNIFSKDSAQKVYWDENNKELMH